MQDDQYSRTRRLLGQQARDTLRGARVAVCSSGGVGGHATEVLARSGVGSLTLVDSDTVALSNLNRQLVALHSTLGQYKVDAMAARIADIDPTIQVTPVRLFFGPDTADRIDITGFDYVLDCIDTVTAKLLLIQRCQAAGVPVLSSMGAANKLDPTAFRVADIEKTSVVFSTEPPLQPLPDPAAEVPADPDKPRRSIPASNAFVPAACGLVMGGEAVKDLLRAAGTLRK